MIGAFVLYRVHAHTRMHSISSFCNMSTQYDTTDLQCLAHCFHIRPKFTVLGQLLGHDFQPSHLLICQFYVYSPFASFLCSGEPTDQSIHHNNMHNYTCILVNHISTDSFNDRRNFEKSCPLLETFMEHSL